MKKFKTIDGCEAAAYVAYRVNETMAIYPITPSSPIAALANPSANAPALNTSGTTKRRRSAGFGKFGQKLQQSRRNYLAGIETKAKRRAYLSHFE